MVMCVCVHFYDVYVFHDVISLVRLKRKGATPPSRGDVSRRDLHSRMMPVHPAMPTHSASGTKHRRRRNSSNSSPEHIGNLMSSPNLHVRTNKVRKKEFLLATTRSLFQLFPRSSIRDPSRVDFVFSAT